jgi:hypothetical protein
MTDTMQFSKKNRLKCSLPPITRILIESPSSGIFASSAFRGSRRWSSIAWSSRISLVGTSASPTRRALGTASMYTSVSRSKMGTYQYRPCTRFGARRAGRVISVTTWRRSYRATVFSCRRIIPEHNRSALTAMSTGLYTPGWSLKFFPT